MPTAKNIVPIITCNPWKPVPKKKDAPNTPSLIVKDDTLYSIYWKIVNIIANSIVYNEPYNVPPLTLFISAWWAKVTVAPLDNNITVFNKGNSKGLTGSIPTGGHCAPNSTVGVKALWKKAQNIAIKNKPSDTINNINPKFSPFCTASVWSPKNVPSDIISLNQKNIESITIITPKNTK